MNQQKKNEVKTNNTKVGTLKSVKAVTNKKVKSQSLPAPIQNSKTVSEDGEEEQANGLINAKRQRAMKKTQMPQRVIKK